MTRALTVLLCLASTVVAEDQRAAYDDMEARPYDVSVRVVFADDPALTANVRDRAVVGLRAACESTFGAAWRADVAEEYGLAMSSGDDLEHLRAVDLGVDLDSNNRPDKVFVVAVRVRDDGLFEAAAREFDTAVRAFGHVARRTTGRWEQLGRTLFTALHDTYRPIVVATEIDNETVKVRRLAAEFTVPDASAADVRPGTLLVPFLRYLDKEGEVGRVITVPWTYLRTDEVGETVSTTTISGLRGPLGTRVRRRVQVVGLAVRPRFDVTRVRLAPRSAPNTPAAGLRVRAIRKELPRDESEVEPLELMTDRLGHVDVPRDDAHRMTWLYVHSGDALLARVPIAVGADPVVPFLIPDDRPRLTVEGRVEILQADLIDAVAARETLIRRIKIHENKSEWSKVDPLIAELKSMPTAAAFEQRLETIRATPFTEATEAGNALALHGIRRLVDKTRDRIRKYLDPKRVEEMLAELEENRKADAGDLGDATLEDAGLE